ncbi:MAG: hypothetical protein LBT45_01285 [Rickettsiales bacterium]|jgi:hypothetical protein|nr:hypothetical protein [Rickettsiales bacterium]
MKKLALLAAFAAICAPSYADDNPAPQRGGPGGGGFMRNLTEEQRACVEKADCPKIERKAPEGAKPDDKERGERPERPEMSEEEKAAMKESRECLDKAFEDCGIEKPERPEGGRPGPGGKVPGKGPKPQE